MKIKSLVVAIGSFLFIGAANASHDVVVDFNEDQTDIIQIDGSDPSVENLAIIPSDNQRTTRKWDASDYVSTNGYPTIVRFKNKGGYSAEFNAEFGYLYPDGDRGIRRLSSVWVNNGTTVEFHLPTNALHLTVTAKRKTGLAWSPIRDIVSKDLCSYTNKWTDHNNQVNIIQLDVWGTTIHPKWKFMEPSGTTDNGADTSKVCGSYNYDR